VASLRGWLDVLIHAKEIRWIVLALDGHQAHVVVPIARFDALLALFHHEIHVRATRRIEVYIVPLVPGPVDGAVLVRRVGIGSHDHLGPGDLPVAPRRVVIAQPLCCAPVNLRVGRLRQRVTVILDR